MTLDYFFSKKKVVKSTHTHATVVFLKRSPGRLSLAGLRRGAASNQVHLKREEGCEG